MIKTPGKIKYQNVRSSRVEGQGAMFFFFWCSTIRVGTPDSRSGVWARKPFGLEPRSDENFQKTRVYLSPSYTYRAFRIVSFYFCYFPGPCGTPGFYEFDSLASIGYFGQLFRI